MISTNERQEWLKTLEKHKLVSFMHQNSGGQEVWLNLLASVAAWASPILDRISDFFPLYTPHNYLDFVILELQSYKAFYDFAWCYAT